MRQCRKDIAIEGDLYYIHVYPGRYYVKIPQDRKCTTAVHSVSQ